MCLLPSQVCYVRLWVDVCVNFDIGWNCVISLLLVMKFGQRPLVEKSGDSYFLSF
jgi:hypothetical protein